MILNLIIFTFFQSRGENVISEVEAKVLAAKINAVYVETSSKTRKQLKDAFDAAILAGLPVIHAKKPFWKKLLCLYQIVQKIIRLPTQKCWYFLNIMYFGIVIVQFLLYIELVIGYLLIKFTISIQVGRQVPTYILHRQVHKLT